MAANFLSLVCLQLFLNYNFLFQIDLPRSARDLRETSSSKDLPTPRVAHRSFRPTATHHRQTSTKGRAVQSPARLVDLRGFSPAHLKAIKALRAVRQRRQTERGENKRRHSQTRGVNRIKSARPSEVAPIDLSQIRACTSKF